jgi:8-oxo-dGTP pyrophosphatase MutT (NUDIX family)
MMDRVPQAGGIVVRQDGDRLSILLVKARKDPAVWIFPKGHIDPGETAEATALRETQEEAGVDGELLGPVGPPLEYLSGREPVSVRYFLIRAGSESPSPEGREKQWFPFDEALKALVFEDSRRLVRAARSLLEKGI